MFQYTVNQYYSWRLYFANFPRCQPVRDGKFLRPSLIYIHTCLFFYYDCMANILVCSKKYLLQWGFREPPKKFLACEKKLVYSSLSYLSLLDASNTWYLLSWFSLQVQVSYTLKDGRKMLRTISKSLSTTDCREAMEEVRINRSAEYTCRYPLAIIIYLPLQTGTISMLMHASVLQKNYFILQRT